MVAAPPSLTMTFAQAAPVAASTRIRARALLVPRLTWVAKRVPTRASVVAADTRLPTSAVAADALMPTSAAAVVIRLPTSPAAVVVPRRTSAVVAARKTVADVRPREMAATTAIDPRVTANGQG